MATAASAAAAEAQTNSDLMRASRAAGGDAQSRYYSLAHRCGRWCLLHIRWWPWLLQWV